MRSLSSDTESEEDAEWIADDTTAQSQMVKTMNKLNKFTTKSYYGKLGKYADKTHDTRCVCRETSSARAARCG